MFNESIQGNINGPSQKEDTTAKSFFAHPPFLRPLCKSKGFPAKCYDTVSPFIVLLFFLGAPAYISRFIIPIIINTLNSMFRCRFWTDMFIKQRKRCDPRRKYFYSSAAVINKMVVFWVIAALSQIFPCVIFLRPAFIMGEVDEPNHLGVDTATTLSMLRPKMSPVAYADFSASTVAFPAGKPLFAISDTASNGKMPESFPGKILQCRHDVTSWLRVVVEKVCWKAVNQSPLFGSYPIQHGVY